MFSATPILPGIIEEAFVSVYVNNLPFVFNTQRFRAMTTGFGDI